MKIPLLRLVATLATCASVAMGPGTMAQCSISIGNDTVICQGTQASLHGPAGFSNYQWSSGQTVQNISTGTAGDYVCTVTYPSGNLVTNGDFSAGNTGFTTQFTYSATSVQNEGYYAVGTNAHDYHSQFFGTGTGNFLVGNAGYASWFNNVLDVWCQTIPVCPGQTYTLSYSGRTLSDALPARILWNMDGIGVWPEATMPAFSAGWQTFSINWTAGPAQTSVDACLRVTSGDGIGDDFGIDNISISGTIVLTDTVHVTVTPLPVVGLGPDLGLCQGDQITLDATVPGGSYLWNDGTTAATHAVSNSGNYAVTVTAQNCSNSDQVNIIFNPVPTIDLGPDQMICPGATTTFDATTPGATYLWSTGSTAPTLTTGTVGNYSVQVTVNGCSASDAIDLANFNLQAVNIGPDISICPGTSTQVGVDIPGATYLWSTGATTDSISVASAGQVWVQTTLNGCINSDTLIATITNVPAVDIGPDVQVCPGSTIPLNATTTGATAYLWNNGSTSPTLNAGPGNWQVQVSVNGCTATDAITIGTAPVPSVDLGPDQLICPGATATFDATAPGATYLWNTGSTAPNITTGIAGNYSVQVTVNGCSASDAVSLGIFNLQSVDLGADRTICAGQTTQVGVDLVGAAYLWSNGATTDSISVSNAGTVWLQVTMNGCVASDTLLVSVNPVPTLDLGADQQLCPGNTVLLDATSTGADAYLWNNGATTPVINAGVGTWTVQVTMAGCDNLDSVVIGALPAPVVDLGPDTAICTNSSLLLTASSPGSTYLWNDGSTLSQRTVGPGTWSVTATQFGCSTSDTTVISPLPMPQLTLPQDTTLCFGTTWQADVSQTGASFLWSTGDSGPVLTVDSPGTYTVTATIGPCSSIAQTIVSYMDLSYLTLGPDSTLCPGESLMVGTNAPGVNVTWSDGYSGTMRTITAAGLYQALFQSGNCSKTDDVSIDYTPLPALDLGMDRIICQGDTTWLDPAIGAAQLQWSTGSTELPLPVSSTGTISGLLLLDGCTSKDTIFVLVKPFLDHVDLGADRSICPDADFTLDATTPGATYTWNDGSHLATLEVTKPGEYHVSVNGFCISATDTVLVHEGRCATLVLVPNAFSPDGDGINETFMPIVSDPVDQWDVAVYDRWGEKVFTSSSPQYGWDGTVKGSKAPVGVYVWTLRYAADTDEGVEQVKRMGTVTLVR